MRHVILMLKKSDSFNDVISYHSIDSDAVLIEALKANNAQAIEFFLSVGVDRDVKSKQEHTALDIALKNKNFKILTCLLPNL